MLKRKYYTHHTVNLVSVPRSTRGSISKTKSIKKKAKNLFGYNSSVLFSHLNGHFASVSKQKEQSFSRRNSDLTEQSLSFSLVCFLLPVDC